MKKFIAGENENGVRLSRFVESVTRDMPRSLLYKSFRNKRIKVNGKRGEADTRLSSGDVIELYINDEFFPEKPVVPAKKPPRRQPPVKVIYQDENIAVLYKPPTCCATATAPAMPTWWMPFVPSCRPAANMTPRLKTALHPPSATGWTAAPRGL